jgi:transposase
VRSCAHPRTQLCDDAGIPELPGKGIEPFSVVIERLSGEVARVIVPFLPLLALLMTIPGVDRRTAEVILAEIGTDMARVPTAMHLANWAGLCPANHESAGKHLLGQDPQGLQAATDHAEPGGHRRRRQQRDRPGRPRRSDQGPRWAQERDRGGGPLILVIAWHLHTRNQPSTGLGADDLLERQTSEAYRNRLVRQLGPMGHKVTLAPAQVA